MKHISIATLTAICSIAAQSAHAETFWSNTSLSYLAGSNYVDAFKDYNIDNNGIAFDDSEVDGSYITFEHAGAYNWGKSFAFIDIFNTDDKDITSDETYLELGSDLSLTRGAGFQDLIIKDIYIATQLENGVAAGDNFTNLLAGIGLRWNVSHFSFLDTNLYYRANENADNNGQITVAWGLPFTIGPVAMTFDGFMDITNAIDSDNDQGGQSIIHAQPQLKMDVGNFWDKPNKFYAGIEVDFWQNKFGFKNVDQTVVQAMAQINY
jgi:hypothetical protein